MQVFQKTLMGINPLGSARDWTMLGVLLALVLSAMLALGSQIADAGVMLGMAIGGVGGMLPSIAMCLPVHGEVAPAARPAFMRQVAVLGFIDAGGTPSGQLYNHKTPHWMRWDSNRVLLRARADGGVDATIPLYAYMALRRKSA